jgi:hypothetical protein
VLSYRDKRRGHHLSVKQPTPSEQLAADVVATVLGCTAHFVDDGTYNSVVDFVGNCPRGGHFALEISRMTNPRALNLAASAIKSGWRDERLQYAWYLGVGDEASLRALRSQVGALLLELERAGELGLFVDPVDRARDAAMTLRDLGVIQASASDRSEAGVIFVYPLWPGGSYHPGRALNGRVELEAADNAEKLRRSGLRTGHLFLWVDSLAHPVAGSLIGDMDRDYIGDPPSLPPGVDVVWAVPDPLPTRTSGGHPVWPFRKARMSISTWCEMFGASSHPRRGSTSRAWSCRTLRPRPAAGAILAEPGRRHPSIIRTSVRHWLGGEAGAQRGPAAEHLAAADGQHPGRDTPRPIRR